jgi:hypothetical protein
MSEPGLCARYHAQRVVIAESLWSTARFIAIAKLNLGVPLRYELVQARDAER